MDILVLVIGVITFLICFLIHVIWWRRQHPKSDILVLMLIFYIIPSMFILSYAICGHFVNGISIELLHIALSSAYIAGYPAVQAASPSLNILLIVDRSMPKGITKEEIRKTLGEGVVLDISIERMLEENLAKESGNIFSITKLGNKIALFFILFRTILGIRHGKG